VTLTQHLSPSKPVPTCLFLRATLAPSSEAKYSFKEKLRPYSIGIIDIPFKQRTTTLKGRNKNKIIPLSSESPFLWRILTRGQFLQLAFVLFVCFLIRGGTAGSRERGRGERHRGMCTLGHWPHPDWATILQIHRKETYSHKTWVTQLFQQGCGIFLSPRKNFKMSFNLLSSNSWMEKSNSMSHVSFGGCRLYNPSQDM